ncbi:hypothetical protein KJ707_03305 [Patescibacteria group bacterium]|nr:hypothetical protein [Patescibacteria group bacterium]MBU2543565.1 hypothetical protein [Patescibacteria group bacterium]
MDHSTHLELSGGYEHPSRRAVKAKLGRLAIDSIHVASRQSRFFSFP